MPETTVPEGYRTQAEDTSVAAELYQVAGWKRMSPEARVQRMWELTDVVRGLAEIQVRRLHPEASEREIRLRVASRHLDRDLMIRAFDWDPAVHGY